MSKTQNKPVVKLQKVGIHYDKGKPCPKFALIAIQFIRNKKGKIEEQRTWYGQDEEGKPHEHHVKPFYGENEARAAKRALKARLKSEKEEKQNKAQQILKHRFS